MAVKIALRGSLALCLVLCIELVWVAAEAASLTPAAPEDPQPVVGEPKVQLGSYELARLRKMFHDSHELATDAFHEINALKYMSKHPDATDEEVTNVVKLQLDSQINKLLATTPAPSNTNGLPSNHTTGSHEGHKHSKTAVKPGVHAGGKSDARQSSLLSGFAHPQFQPIGNGPFMGGFMRQPSMPSLPALLPSLANLPSMHGFAPGQLQGNTLLPRPPKTSILGNGGGPMSLTNDNVVVVNVLSGNY